MKKENIYLIIPMILLLTFAVLNIIFANIGDKEVFVDIKDYSVAENQDSIYFSINFKSKEVYNLDTCYEKPFVCLEIDENGYVENDYAVKNKNDCDVVIKRICTKKDMFLKKYRILNGFSETLANGLLSAKEKTMKIEISKSHIPVVKNFYIDGVEWEKYAWKNRNNIYKKGIK